MKLDAIVGFFRNNKITTLLIVCAFFAGDFASDVRSDQKQREENTEDIRELKTAVRSLHTGVQNLADGQERMLCRLDGESPAQCEREVGEIPEIDILYITNSPTTVQDGTAISN